MKFNRKFITCALWGLYSPFTLALESVLIKNGQGQAVFNLRFYGPNDGEFSSGDRSTRVLSPTEKSLIISSAEWYARLLKTTPGQQPLVVNVGTDNTEGNASAASHMVDRLGLYASQAVFRKQPLKPNELDVGAHGVMIMGLIKHNADTRFSALPVGKVDGRYSATVNHEFFHMLGMNTSIENQAKDKKNSHSPKIADGVISNWTAGLRDDNDNPARPGQTLLCDDCENPATKDVFDLRKDQGYFTGKNVAEVLAGALKGIPVKIMDEDGFEVNDNYLSHSELKNSLLSHQNYRSYMAPMEAELALLQDLGYSIDRKNFYGFSIYGDNKTIYNKQGYFARNGQGTAYLNGQFNSATLGTGLHIYGSHNTVYQQADLLTKGQAGVGVRIDGEGNRLYIPHTTRIAANGENGYGLLVAYGKDHRIVQQGNIEALKGVAANFDFGANVLGPETEVRGSYIRRVEGDTAKVLDELAGALVNHYDVSGALTGKLAAIYIGATAWVKNINILGGAAVRGDIISNYSEKDDKGEMRTTTLSLGKKMNARGEAVNEADNNFRFNYQGNITSQKKESNLVLDLVGGISGLNGHHKLQSVVIRPGATLESAGSFSLAAGNPFINSGTLATGVGNQMGTLTINGGYLQKDNATLQIKTRAIQHSVLNIKGDAALAGRMQLQPQADYYPSGWNLSSSSLVKVSGERKGTFDKIEGQLTSPTLILSQRKVADGIQWRIDRAPNAYQQYSVTENAKAVASALESVARQPLTGGMASLLAALDFSEADGRSVGRALPQLTHEPYSMVINSTLNSQSRQGEMIQTASRALPAGEWRSFADTFGGGYWQDSRGSIVGYESSSYGILAGAEKGSEAFNNWTFGFSGAISGQKNTARSPYNATSRSTALDIGLHARYQLPDNTGLWMFYQAHAGVEDGKMDRKVAVNGYQGSNQGSWTGVNGGLRASVGYQWQLTEGLNAGPFASLDYLRLHQPSVTESGDQPLYIASGNLDNLRSTIGLGAEYQDRGLTLALKAGWEKSLLDNGYGSEARFRQGNGPAFRATNSLGGRNALALSAGANYRLNSEVDIGAGISSRLGQQNASTLGGNLSIRWRF